MSAVGNLLVTQEQSGRLTAWYRSERFRVPHVLPGPPAEFDVLPTGSWYCTPAEELFVYDPPLLVVWPIHHPDRVRRLDVTKLGLRLEADDMNELLHFCRVWHFEGPKWHATLQ